MKETEKAYLAGLIDGEGTISIVRIKPIPGIRSEWWVAAVEISNTDKKMIGWLIERLGGTVILGNRKKAGKGKWRPVYRVSYRDRHAERVIRLVLSYLVVKRKQADLVLSLRSRIKKGNRKALSGDERKIRARLHEECKRLNVRGLTDAERLSERTSEKRMRQSELAGNEPREGEPKSLPASLN